MKNNVYKVDHRYNPTPSWLPSRFRNHQPVATATSSSCVLSSYRGKISDMLVQWNQLQKEKRQCEQKQVQSLSEKRPKQPLCDEFDRIMEEDLENQLKALERQEEEQYKVLETSLQEQLQDNHPKENTAELTMDYRKQLEQIDVLKQFEEESEEKEQPHCVLMNEPKGYKTEAQVSYAKQTEKNMQCASQVSVSRAEIR